MTIQTSVAVSRLEYLNYLSPSLRWGLYSSTASRLLCWCWRLSSSAASRLLYGRWRPSSSTASRLLSPLLCLFATFLSVLCASTQPPTSSSVDPNRLLAPSYRYALSICTISQNDAPYLKEWIDFHKCVGVEHFYLFNHGSQDDMDAVLQPYIDAGEVELFHWPVIPKQLPISSQVDVYNWTLRYATGETKWLAFIDTDEFLFPVKEDNLVDFLADYEDFGGVVVNWQMYGTSGVERIQPGEFLIEKLVWKAEPRYGENRAVKSIVRPEWTLSNNMVHDCCYIEGKWAVDENFKRVKGGVNDNYPISLIRINHYFLRDRHFAYGVKLRRLQKWSETKTPYKVIKERIDNFEKASHIVFDPIIHRFLPALRSLQQQ